MQNRRKFLKTSLLTAAGAGLASKSFSNHSLSSTQEEKKFIYRTLGKTRIKIPIISMGTGNTNNPNLIREALNQGVKLFATSEYYQNGNNEKMLGEVFKEFPRDSFHIITGTAGGLDIDYQNGLFKPGTNPEKYLEHANECLERLQVEYVDFFSLGFAARKESVFFEPIVKALEKFKKEGKAKFLCCATHSFEPEAIRAAADVGIYDVVMTAYNFRKNNIAEIDEAIAYAAEKGLGVIAMKTMAGVYWDKERTRPINTKASLKWVLKNETIHTTVPDCSSFDHLYQNLGLMDDLELSEEEKRDLESPSEELSKGIYCQQCSKCIPQCPEGLDIPTIMRSYMYAYGHKNLHHAQHTFDMARIPDEPCSECSSCVVDCTMGFDIKNKIQDIARIRDIPREFVSA